MNAETLTLNKNSWDEAAPRFFGRTALPEYGPLAPLEDELNLMGDVTGLNVLELGCGSGHSLQYMERRGARGLWGIDLSRKQIETASELLASSGARARLFESPMEQDPGLPHNYFDLVYSIFALGWTTNIDRTFANVNAYLKEGGLFIFSWEHPFYNRAKFTDNGLILNKSYHEEGPYDHEAWHTPAIMQQFKVSTYINALIKHGFVIDNVVEEVRLPEDGTETHANRWYSYDKARFLPTTLIIKSHKKSNSVT
ncbi:class I SAM-dependent methyltransferase [Paenibacillus spongiae]|uniref:Class I SAM-dependent methyltransferase n=1 Tax=Paenibacillus spongiae TaxID=2909671 RepID=A0ABY5S2D8_9BACL|nr:class I SAM-dependent methyltransferase [Paenibacillus spongiae]UVI27608.1 class I SAM-dependent methyltransferase [Paenibacillus spongiae]